jgi:Xaa-Pro dipeptidase
VKLEEIQRAIRDEQLDGWLFFDHHERDPLAYGVLGFAPKGIVSRRWYYFIPAEGQPRKLVHKIESFHLDSLPGAKTAYSGWLEQKTGLGTMLTGAHRIAMQYSPDCAIPYVSMVDGGTIDLIRDLGIEIATSADLIQYFEARWNQEQLDSHLEAGKLVDAIRRDAFRLIGDRIHAGERVTEWQVQEFIKERFSAEDLFTDHGPNVSANANAANPHYAPQPDHSAEIGAGDTVLIDLWAKLNRPNAVYYDITWVGCCTAAPSSDLVNVFNIVRDARDRAIERVQKAAQAGEELRGYQVDDAARSYIQDCGYGEFFFHRTGHSIGTAVHGAGANMDNLETHDLRRIIPWTCFSIEPGIYLKDFGVRLEVNMFVGEGSARVTGEIQRDLVRI